MLFDFSTIPLKDYWILLQVLSRVSALVAIAPVFGASQVPAQVKVLLSLLLSLILWPLAYSALHSQPVPIDLYSIAFVLIGNALIGLAMGFVVSLILTAVQMAGSIMDLQVGFTIAQTFNPEIGALAAPLTQLQYLYAMMLFILANGHYMLISALGHSFAMMPVSMLTMPSMHALDLVTQLTANTLISGVVIAAPAASVMLIVDLSFAYLARAVPNMNIFFVGTPAKLLIGLVLSVAVLPMTAILVGHLISRAPYDLSASMSAMVH
jgi:flagellar biosynthetic protein FliR